MFLGTGISVAVQTWVIGKKAWTWYLIEIRGYMNMFTATHLRIHRPAWTLVWKNVGVIIVYCHHQRATCTYICTYMHAFIHMFIGRVLHNIDVIGFAVSDLVIWNALCMWTVWRHHTFLTFLVAWVLGMSGKLFAKIKIQYSVTPHFFHLYICDRLYRSLYMNPLLLCVMCYTCQRLWCHCAVGRLL